MKNAIALLAAASALSEAVQAAPITFDFSVT